MICALTRNLTLLTIWTKEWEKSRVFKGKYFGFIQPVIPYRPWFYKHKNFNRTITTTICRLRFGHSCRPTHLRKLRIRDNSICECGLDEGSIDHVIFSCPLQNISLYDVLPTEMPRPTSAELILSLAFTPFINILCKYISVTKLKL